MAKSDNIWSNCFSSGSDILGTTVRSGTQSKVAMCSISKSDRATIAYSLTAAIVSFIENRVSVAKVSSPSGSDILWVENKSRNVSGRNYITGYDTTLKKVTSVVAQNGLEYFYDLVSDSFAHWSVFTPRIAEILLNDPQGEFAESFKSVKEEYEKNSVISKSNDLFILNDYLYQTRMDYVQLNRQIEKMPLNMATMTEDMTPKITGSNGVFEFASTATVQQAAQKKTKSVKKAAANSSSNSKTTGLELEWERDLTDGEKELIPDYDLKTMKITPDIQSLALMVKEEHKSKVPVNNILLYGEAGAGKSTAVELLAQMWGIPYRFVNLSLNSEESDLIGTYRPKADGTFEFYEPSFAKSFRDGGVIELMEINYSRPGALGVINSAMDKTAKITLGNGEIVKRHPNCIITATTNVGYAGCQQINEALKDRFQDMVAVEKLTDKELIDITINNSGNDDQALIAKMVDAVRKISKKMEEEQITGGVCSTRQLINWARKNKYTNNPIRSARTTILPGATLSSEIQNEIIDTILKPMF